MAGVFALFVLLDVGVVAVLAVPDSVLAGMVTPLLVLIQLGAFHCWMLCAWLSWLLFIRVWMASFWTTCSIRLEV